MKLQQNGICNCCTTETGDKYYIFCSINCQKAWHNVIERHFPMTHSFVGSALDRSICATCKRDAMAHTNCAQCEACPKKGNCNLVEDVLMCASCEMEHLRAVKTEMQTADEIIEAAKKIDKSITYNGDFFNARVVAHAEIIDAIDKEEISEQSKVVKMNAYLLEQYKHFSDVIFQLDKQKHDAVLEQIAVAETTRQLGERIGKEVAEKIKQLDQNYTPIKSAQIKVKVANKNLSPFERIVQQLSISSGMTMEQARQALIDGGVTMTDKK
jgi:hypothetical protein